MRKLIIIALLLSAITNASGQKVTHYVNGKAIVYKPTVVEHINGGVRMQKNFRHIYLYGTIVVELDE